MSGWKQAATIAVIAATALLLTLRTPTFDLDEALYRRVAEEMKASHEYFVTTWDGKRFFEKPPTYVWTIVAASWVVDGPSRTVSILASRLPSVCFSLLTIAMLAAWWKRERPRVAAAFGMPAAASASLPVAAYAASLLPMAGIASVLLDPMLTLCLTAVLLTLTSAFLRGAGNLRLSGREMLTIALAMAAATAVKGLVGIILPAFAIATHQAIAFDAVRFRSVLRAIALPFAFAAAIAAGVFALFSARMGQDFLVEFIIRQHFLRGATALQGHGGPPVFYLIVLLGFGGVPIALVLRMLTARLRRTLPFAAWGFPLSWAAAVILFYTPLATKLANYIWPVWPALTVALCILLTCAKSDESPGALRRWIGRVGDIAPAALALALLGIACGADRLFFAFSASGRTRAILAAVEPLPFSVRVALFAMGSCFVLQLIIQRRIAQNSVVAGALVNCMLLTIGAVGVVPHIEARIRGPLVRLSQDASARTAAGGDLTTVGLFSPTVSSNYEGTIRQVGSLSPRLFETPTQHLMIAPAWLARPCAQRGFRIIDRDQFLLLCEKPAALSSRLR